jgi:hypothetical protein
VPSVGALLDWPECAAAMDASDERVTEVKSRTATLREPAPVTRHRRIGADMVPASKLASACDWEVPEWYDVALWYLGDHRSYNIFQRHRRDWERIHLFFCLARFGILDTDAEVVVLADAPDRFAHVLARRVRKVHLVNTGRRSNDRFLRAPELRLDSSIRVYKGLSDPAFRGIEAAALVVQRYHWRAFAGSYLARACRVLKPDGVVGFSLDVSVRSPTGLAVLGRWLHLRPNVDDLAKDRFRARLPHEFKPIPSADWSLDPESFEMVAPPADWSWRQMTAERYGQRITSAIRWFSRGG